MDDTQRTAPCSISERPCVQHSLCQKVQLTDPVPLHMFEGQTMTTYRKKTGHLLSLFLFMPSPFENLILKCFSEKDLESKGDLFKNVFQSKHNIYLVIRNSCLQNQNKIIL